MLASDAVATETPRHLEGAESRAPGMATFASLDAVRRRIQSLQQAAFEAAERAELLREEADLERHDRERVTPSAHGEHAAHQGVDQGVIHNVKGLN